MGINQLPPQAYTRETLMQAFDWIKTQPQQVQNLASSTDALVSVYMQARRRAGSSPITHPVSSQSFKQDLKNLAEGLRAFDEESAPAVEGHAHAVTSHAAASHSLPPQAHVPPPQMHQQQQTFHSAPAAQPSYAAPMNSIQQPQIQYQAPQYQMPQQMPPQQMSHQLPPQQMAPRAIPSAYNDPNANLLDAKSMEVVRVVQSRFNLSSEGEALRMLISLGFEKVREIFPKS